MKNYNETHSVENTHVDSDKRTVVQITQTNGDQSVVYRAEGVLTVEQLVEVVEYMAEVDAREAVESSGKTPIVLDVSGTHPGAQYQSARMKSAAEWLRRAVEPATELSNSKDGHVSDLGCDVIHAIEGALRDLAEDQSP